MHPRRPLQGILPCPVRQAGVQERQRKHYRGVRGTYGTISRDQLNVQERIIEYQHHLALFYLASSTLQFGLEFLLFSPVIHSLYKGRFEKSTNVHRFNWQCNASSGLRREAVELQLVIVL